MHPKGIQPQGHTALLVFSALGDTPGSVRELTSGDHLPRNDSQDHSTWRVSECTGFELEFLMVVTSSFWKLFLVFFSFFLLIAALWGLPPKQRARTLVLVSGSALEGTQTDTFPHFF